MCKKTSSKRGIDTPLVQIEEALRHARGMVETAQTAVISPNASYISIGDTLAAAVDEIDRAANLIARKS